MDFKFEFSEKLYDSDYCRIIDLLNSHYLNTLHFKNEGIRRGFGLYVKNEFDDIAGGLVGFSELNWMYVDSLYVCENYRKNGLATSLLTQAEAIAKSRNCVGIKLECFKDNLGFYQKRGFDIFYIENSDDATPTYYVKKLLTNPGSVN